MVGEKVSSTRGQLKGRKVSSTKGQLKGRKVSSTKGQLKRKGGKLCKAQLKIQAGKNHRFLVPSSSKGQLKRRVGKSCKAQLKIQEMAFMLVAVVIFFVLVGLFVLSIYTSNLRESGQEIAQENAITLVNNLAKTPEFSFPDKTNAVDEDKIMVLKDIGEYEEIWGFSSLSVITESGLNKKEGEMVKCSPENYPNCDFIEIYDNDKGEKGVPMQVFVSLCRKEKENEIVYEKCEIGEVLISVENE